MDPIPGLETGFSAIPSVQLHTLFRWREVQRSLASLGISPSSISGYTDVNELRVLNNAIKHEGRVSSELARFGYTFGHRIPDLSGAYERFQNACTDFIRGTSEAIIKHHNPSGKIVTDLDTDSQYFFGTKIEI